MGKYITCSVTVFHKFVCVKVWMYSTFTRKVPLMDTAWLNHALRLEYLYLKNT